MKDKIAIITTGGTIFSKTSEKGSTNTGSETEKNINKLKKTILDKNMEIHETINIDSSDLTINHIRIINEKIKDLDSKGLYKSYIILHGTDTMAYSGSAISLLNRYTESSIILTGSMESMSKKETDAFNNIYCAILAAQEELLGTFICFGNKLLQANKTKKIANNRYNAFESPFYPEIGNFLLTKGKEQYTNKTENKVLIINDKTKNKLDEIIKENLTNKDLGMKNEFGLSENFAIVKAQPFCKISEIIKSHIKQQYEGIVIEGYGDGNLPNQKCLENFINDGYQKGILFALSTQCIIGESNCQYIGGKNLIDKGLCVPTRNMTQETVAAKMSFAIGNRTTYEGRKKILIENIAGELNAI